MNINCAIGCLLPNHWVSYFIVALFSISLHRHSWRCKHWSTAGVYFFVWTTPLLPVSIYRPGRYFFNKTVWLFSESLISPKMTLHYRYKESSTRSILWNRWVSGLEMMTPSASFSARFLTLLALISRAELDEAGSGRREGQSDSPRFACSLAHSSRWNGETRRDGKMREMDTEVMDGLEIGHGLFGGDSSDSLDFTWSLVSQVELEIVGKEDSGLFDSSQEVDRVAEILCKMLRVKWFSEREKQR